MDPDEALAEMLRISDRVLNEQLDSPRAQRLAELVEGLNSWITKGGFLPEAWKPETKALIKLAKDNDEVCVCLGQGLHTLGAEGCVGYALPRKR